jgi:2-polyprenyl-3-methyl-5-hydroxy-6-metoxy-1,4-benzoquinol methylase
MPLPHLPITTAADTAAVTSDGNELRQQRLKARAYWEKLWRCAPQRLDPRSSSHGRQELAQIWSLVQQISSEEQDRTLKACDLGCGAAVTSQRLVEAGWYVDLVDISSLALQRLQNGQHSHMSFYQEYVPFTERGDTAYNLVLCTNLIAELPQAYHRLCIAELTRLVKPQGYIICSTPLDLGSEDALERFTELVETELNITAYRLSYQRLWLYWHDVLAAPRRLARAAGDSAYRAQALDQRSGWRRYRFKLLSAAKLGFTWKIASKISEPLYRLFNNSDRLLNYCERISRFLWQESAVTHVTILGQRRPLIPPEATTATTPIQEAYRKKSSWQ